MECSYITGSALAAVPTGLRTLSVASCDRWEAAHFSSLIRLSCWTSVSRHGSAGGRRSAGWLRCRPRCRRA